jgi:hypothetical protein
MFSFKTTFHANIEAKLNPIPNKEYTVFLAGLFNDLSFQKRNAL